MYLDQLYFPIHLILNIFYAILQKQDENQAFIINIYCHITSQLFDWILATFIIEFFPKGDNNDKSKIWKPKLTLIQYYISISII